MIKSNELRIGNWVKERITMMQEKEPSVVVNEYYIQIASKHFCGTRYGFFPIPLTPEILEKCGFIKDVEREEKFVSINGETADTYYNDTFNPSELALFKDGSIHAIDGTFIFSVQLKYLHQLQNLYFALTGEELKINLNVEAHQ